MSGGLFESPALRLPKRVVIFTGARHMPRHYRMSVRAMVVELIKEQSAIFVGDCPTGLDSYVYHCCKRYDRAPRVYFADWQRYGLKAGPERNGRMVKAARELMGNTGASLWCYAWPFEESRGTRNCMKQAEKAGATVVDKSWK